MSEFEDLFDPTSFVGEGSETQPPDDEDEGQDADDADDVSATPRAKPVAPSRPKRKTGPPARQDKGKAKKAPTDARPQKRSRTATSQTTKASPASSRPKARPHPSPAHVAPDGRIVSETSGGDPLDSDLDFSIVIQDPGNFLHTVDIVKELIPDLVLTVEDTPEFKGLSLEQQDKSKTCIVIARFACTVNLRPDDSGVPVDNTFCISCANLQSCLRLVNPLSTLKILKPRGDPKIHFKSYEGSTDFPDLEFSITTIEMDRLAETVDGLKHTYTIDIGLVVVKDLVKNAKEVDADDIEFIVMEPADARNEPSEGSVTGIEVEKARHIFIAVKISAQGVDVKKNFHSIHKPVQDDQDGGDSEGQGEATRTMRTEYEVEPVDGDLMSSVESRHQLETTFAAKYDTELLHRFLKGMKQKQLVLSLGTDGDGRVLPIVVHYPLKEKSYVEFLMCSKAEGI